MIKAVVFDIGRTLVHYKNPLNWRVLYEPALKNVASLCDYQLTEKIMLMQFVFCVNIIRELIHEKKKFLQTIFGAEYLMHGTKKSPICLCVKKPSILSFEMIVLYMLMFWSF